MQIVTFGVRSYCPAQETVSSLLGWNMMEYGMKKKNVHICMTGSLCCTTEIEGTLSISYTLIKTKEVLLALHSLAMIPLPFLFQFSQHYKAVHFSGLKRRNHFGEKSQGLCR